MYKCILAAGKGYRTVILYLLYGALTTLLNITAYFGLTRMCGLPHLTGNVLAWIISVLFAYASNRSRVFKSRAHGWASILKEGSSFIGCRLGSGLLDSAMIGVFVDLFYYNELLVKTAANLAIIILNYVMSRRVVFPDKGQGDMNYEKNIHRGTMLQ